MPQAMIGKFMPKEERGKGFGYSASAAALGIMLGSPISGLLTGLLSWHWIFLINVPLGIAIIALILSNNSLVESKIKLSKENFDLTGSFLSFFAILGLTFWLNRLNSVGFMNPAMTSLLIVSLFLLIYFIYHCQKNSNALLDLNLLKNKYFSCANSAMFLISGFLAGNNFIMPFYLSEIKHLSEFKIGLLFIIYSASYMTFSLIYGKISKKYLPAKVSFLASFASVLSIIFFIVNIHNSNLVYTVMFFVLLGLSFSFFITSNNNYIMQQAKNNNEGAVAGLHRMTGRFGMLFGVVILEFLFSYAQKNDLNGFILSYCGGCVICLFATIFSYICINKQKNRT